jgi:hypothetical protein
VFIHLFEEKTLLNRYYYTYKAFELDIEKIGLTADGMAVKAECKSK